MLNLVWHCRESNAFMLTENKAKKKKKEISRAILLTQTHTVNCR